MDQTCILRPMTDDQFEWLIIEEHKVVKGPHLNTLAEIAESLKRTAIVMIAPARDVTLLEHSLADMRPAKLLKALPYAVEDFLSDDVESYHFALPDNKTEDKTHCAVVETVKMVQWTEAFDHVKLNLEAIIPEQCCLPFAEFNFTIATQGNESVIRTDTLQGYACDSQNINFFLTSLFQEKKPEKIHAIQFGDETIHIEASCPVDHEQHEANQYLEFLAQQVFEPSINLRQGEFKPHKRANQVKRLWVLAGSLIVLAIAITFVNNIVSDIVYSSENSNLNSQIDAIYKKNFPNATSIVSPKFRMQEKLKMALSGASGDPFLDITARLGYALKKTPSVSIENMRYTGKVLSVQMTLSSFSELKSFIDELQEQSLNVQQKSATIKNGQVLATLELKENS